MFFICTDRIPNLRRVEVVEVEDDGLSVGLDDRPNLVAGSSLELVNRRIRNQIFEIRAKLLAAVGVLGNDLFRNGAIESWQDTPHNTLPGRAASGRSRRGTRCMQSRSCQERWIVRQSSHIIHEG